MVIDFRVFSDNDVKIVGTSEPYQLGNSLLGNPITDEWEAQWTMDKNDCNSFK
jgi:hypothetical protein